MRTSRQRAKGCGLASEWRVGTKRDGPRDERGPRVAWRFAKTCPGTCRGCGAPSTPIGPGRGYTAAPRFAHALLGVFLGRARRRPCETKNISPGNLHHARASVDRHACMTPAPWVCAADLRKQLILPSHYMYIHSATLTPSSCPSAQLPSFRRHERLVGAHTSFGT